MNITAEQSGGTFESVLTTASFATIGIVAAAVIVVFRRGVQIDVDRPGHEKVGIIEPAQLRSRHERCHGAHSLVVGRCVAGRDGYQRLV